MTKLGGLIAAVAAVVVVAVAALAVVAGDPAGTAWVDLETGACFDLAGSLGDAGDDDPLYRVEVVPCVDEHDAEIVATGELNPDGSIAYPSDSDLLDLVDRRCAAETAGRIDEQRFGLLPIAPDERTWRGRAGRYACLAVVVGGGTATGSAITD